MDIHAKTFTSMVFEVVVIEGRRRLTSNIPTHLADTFTVADLLVSLGIDVDDARIVCGGRKLVPTTVLRECVVDKPAEGNVSLSLMLFRTNESDIANPEVSSACVARLKSNERVGFRLFVGVQIPGYSMHVNVRAGKDRFDIEVGDARSATVNDIILEISSHLKLDPTDIELINQGCIYSVGGKNHDIGSLGSVEFMMRYTERHYDKQHERDEFSRCIAVLDRLGAELTKMGKQESLDRTRSVIISQKVRSELELVQREALRFSDSRREAIQTRAKTLSDILDGVCR